MKSLLDKVNAKLNAQGGFLKAVSVLVGGTAFAQVLGFIFLPVLTRVYSPEDYSILGIYIAIVSIVSVIACFRFEIAIPIAKEQTEAKALFYLSLLSNFTLTLFLYILLFLFYPKLKQYFIVEQLSVWIWLIPLGVFLSGLYSALQYWSTRGKKFKLIAQTRITQSIFSNSISLWVGLQSGAFFGLILGQLFSSGGGVLRLGHDTFRDIRNIPFISLKDVAFKYQNFPKYSSFEALANICAVQLPLIIIASIMIGPKVGYLMLAMKVLGIPMGLVGGAMSQVYLSQAPTFYQKGQLYQYTISILKKIFKIVIVPFIVLAMISPYIFGFIFGENWNGLGYYVLAMIPWYFMQIISSPVSMALHILGKQKTALKLQLFGFVLRVFVLLLLVSFCMDMVITYYIFSGFLFYSIYLSIILFSLKSDRLQRFSS